MSNIIRLVDRTRTTCDWKCPRARYWNYEYLGRGIVKNSTSLPLFMGTTIHDALAAIAYNVMGIDEIAETARMQLYDGILTEPVTPEGKDFANEQSSLVEGLIRGFYKHVWPRLMAQYPKIIAIESEMEFELAPNFVFMTKPDLVVEDKEGELVYIEYKSTSSKKPEWINSWETAVQLHSSVKATEATLGRPVNNVQIIGFYKGYESYGKQSSPMCYAYKKNGNPPFTQDSTLYEYKAGFRRSPTWEMPGGVKAWVESMPDNVLANQFPMTAPIFVNDSLVESFFKQRAIREAAIAEAANFKPLADEDEAEEMLWMLDTYFPQHFDQCQPAYGWNCEFKKLCHGSVQDPLLEGYEFRTPHHAREVF